MRAGPGSAHCRISERTRQLALQTVDERSPRRSIKADEHEAIDGDMNLAHAHPRISLSESGRSVLMASWRVAWRTCRIPMGVPASAARNAAFKAMLRML